MLAQGAQVTGRCIRRAAVPDAGFVAAERRTVEPLVHAPEDIDPALVCRVGVVDGAVVEGERTHTGPFAPVGFPAGAEGRLTPGVPGTLLASRWPEVHLAEVVADGSGLPFLPGVRHVEVVVEVAAKRRCPGEAPAHPLLVGLQFRQRG